VAGLGGEPFERRGQEAETEVAAGERLGDRFEARLDDVLSLSGHVAPPRPTR